MEEDMILKKMYNINNKHYNNLEDLGCDRNYYEFKV